MYGTPKDFWTGNLESRLDSTFNKTLDTGYKPN